jgi:hypothetical protein
VFCEAGGENQPRLIKVGVDSPTKKRWGVFQNPFEGNLLKPPRFSRLGYVSAQVAFVCECKVYQILVVRCILATCGHRLVLYKSLLT